MKRLIPTVLLIFFLPFTLSARTAEKPGNIAPAANDGLSFSGQWFLAWNVNAAGDSTSNAFKLKRGYVTVCKKFNNHFSARVTQDIAIDHEGDGKGDIEIRLKYGYLRYSFEKLLFLTRPFVEVGLVHRPWLDFEQKINSYRVQGSMFLERNSILRSADYGVTFSALIGGELDQHNRHYFNKKHPGKYGSLALGVYNGGGYEAIENNNNKILEARLSLRPAPIKFPGLQLHWIGGYGKGNTANSPDFSVNAFAASFESRKLTLMSTAYSGVGNAFGDAVDVNGDSYKQKGFSQFLELKLLHSRLSALGRYDRFSTQKSGNDLIKERYIAGLACYLFSNARIITDIDYLETRELATNYEKTFEIAIEFSY